jgi:CcmD family protein
MSDLTYLFSAFALLWAGILVYVLRLASLRRSLEKRIGSLQDRLEGAGDLP